MFAAPTEYEYLSPTLSAVTALLYVVVPIAIAVIFRGYAKGTSQYNNCVVETSPRPGSFCWLKGTVAVRPGSIKVVVCESQEISRQIKADDGGVVTVWNEARRSHNSVPFQLALENGTLVDIDAGTHVHLTAPFETVLNQGDQRTLEACASMGDTIWVHGMCTIETQSSFDMPGYRNSGQTQHMVMRGAPAQPIEVYTKSPAGDFESQTWRANLTIVATLLIAITLGAMVLLPYADLAFGKTTSCTTGFWQRHDGYYSGACSANGVTTTHKLVQDPGPGSIIPIRVGYDTTRLGARATAPQWALLGLLGYALVGLVGRLSLNLPLPWYWRATEGAFGIVGRIIMKLNVNRYR
jgi:hypothetical protein